MENRSNRKITAQNYEAFRTGLPDWFKQEIPTSDCLENARKICAAKINTVCVEAKCPNFSFCFKQRKLTFMISGSICTRSCRFCAVSKSKNRLAKPDEFEPQKIAQAVLDLQITYAVITSVSRDDLVDGGAGQFLRTVEAIRGADPKVLTEILIPDFEGRRDSLRTVVAARPEVIGHNIETVSRLYPALRPESDYRRSLEVLRSIKELNSSIVTKSSLMLGLSETEEEVCATLKDLKASGCDILTLGQYLSPSSRHEPVREFISPERFLDYRRLALSIGFKSVLSGPLVRSSFEAENAYSQVCN